jgi:6-methylsalicylate decarboxylase
LSNGTDFHQHVWPDAFRRRLEQRADPPYLRGGHLVLPIGGSFDIDPRVYAPEVRLDELDRAGLDRAVVSLPPTMEPTPDLVDAWHEGAEALGAASRGRLIPLAYERADPAFIGAIVPAGSLPGARMLLTRLEWQGGLAFVHPGPARPRTPAWRTAGVDYAQQMLDAVAGWLADGLGRWPRLRLVFALLGGGAPFQLERLVRRGLDPDAAALRDVWFETSSYGSRALELSLQTFGASRVLFGSDAPVDRVADALAPVRRFGGALERQLLVTNASAVLGDKEEQWAAA